MGSSLGSATELVSIGNETGSIVYDKTTNINSFSQFCIADARGIKLSIKAFLHAPYNNAQMDDALRSQYHLPLEEPFTNLGFTYYIGGGGQKVNADVFNQEGTLAIVDWIFVELRKKLEPTEVLYTRSALIRRDGQIVDGSSPLSFRNAIPDDYYIAIKPSNHLSIVTTDTYSLNDNTTPLNFTNGSVSTWGIYAQYDTGNGIFALRKGDSNSDCQIKCNGASNDKNTILSVVGLLTPNNIIIQQLP